MTEQQHFKRAYETIMSLPPDRFELKPMSSKADRKVARNAAAGRTSGKKVPDGGACGYEIGTRQARLPRSLPFPTQPLNDWAAMSRRHSRGRTSISPAAPVSHVISEIKRQWQDVSRQLAPYQVPAPTKVFRLGVHLFAVQDQAATIATGTGEIR